MSLHNKNNENPVLTGKLHRNTIAAVKHNVGKYMPSH